MTRPLAALVAVCTLAAAGAASAQTARIPFGDLDLATNAGARTFDTRVARAATTFCRASHRPISRISDRSACERAVRQEAMQNLPEYAQVRYASSRLAIVS